MSKYPIRAVVCLYTGMKEIRSTFSEEWKNEVDLGMLIQLNFVSFE